MKTVQSGRHSPCKLLLIVTGSIILNVSSFAQAGFDDYFTGEGLRIHLNIFGDNEGEEVTLIKTRFEPFWSGNIRHLIDPFRYGDHLMQVKDSASEKVIYSRGFSTLFSEWQTTDEAKTTRRSFYQVVECPFPKQPVILEIFERNRQNHFDMIYELSVNPSDKYINRDPPVKAEVSDIMVNGDPSVKADILFLAEGYKADEMAKFISDANRFADYLFSKKPYSDYKSSFNIRAVQSVSMESGTDLPEKDIWKNTALNSNFYTFKLERYLTTYDYKSICDYAELAPHDHIFIIVNHDKYGGGGIYNHYSMGTCDHPLSLKVFIHEFGHGFAGLGDEYYNSSVAYSDFYPPGVEPWEPNLTTLVDFGSKWKDMVNDSIPVPTPNDMMYTGVTGVFEGGGYVAKGVYRPALDCIMKSNSDNAGFCAVCQKAIIRMIDYYCK